MLFSTRFFYLLFFCFTALACKNKRDLKIEEHKDLLIDIEYKSTEKGVFHIIFNNIVLENNYKATYTVSENFLPENKFSSKKVKMLPLKKLPDYIQLRLGTNLKALQINKIQLYYKKNKLTVFGEDLDRYFSFTDNIIFNAENKSLIINQNKKKSAAIIRLNPNYIEFLSR